jgi:hypothetical protein
MSFTATSFIPQSAQANSDAPRVFSYATADTLASTKGAAYFDGGIDYGLKDNDVVLVSAVDGVSFLSITISGTDTTTGSANDFA